MWCDIVFATIIVFNLEANEWWTWSFEEGKSSMKVSLSRDWRLKTDVGVISLEKWSCSKKLTQVQSVATNKLYSKWERKFLLLTFVHSSWLHNAHGWKIQTKIELLAAKSPVWKIFANLNLSWWNFLNSDKSEISNTFWKIFIKI